MKVYKVGKAPADAAYIGRGSKYGNPFIIGVDGDRNLVIAKFRTYAEWRLSKEPHWLDELKNKNLSCYCAPLACHGDVLVSLLSKGE